MKARSQRLNRFAWAPAWICLALSIPDAFAQYTIGWSKVAGGGATTPTTGGVYSLTGTVGQLDAGGPLTNGVYSLVGGFWALPTLVQTSGAPKLAIAPGAPGQAVISWSPVAPGYVLQESTSLEKPTWSNTPGGATTPVNVAAAGQHKFYRLQKP